MRDGEVSSRGPGGSPAATARSSEAAAARSGAGLRVGGRRRGRQGWTGGEVEIRKGTLRARSTDVSRGRLASKIRFPIQNRSGWRNSLDHPPKIAERWTPPVRRIYKREEDKAVSIWIQSTNLIEDVGVSFQRVGVRRRSPPVALLPSPLPAGADSVRTPGDLMARQSIVASKSRVSSCTLRPPGVLNWR